MHVVWWPNSAASRQIDTITFMALSIVTFFHFNWDFFFREGKFKTIIIYNRFERILSLVRTIIFFFVRCFFFIRCEYVHLIPFLVGYFISALRFLTIIKLVDVMVV